MMSPEEAYKYDATFHRVVDLMRAHLSVTVKGGLWLQQELNKF